MLYIVATPIGNLSDITLRAIEILKNCDYILCEDTRHSLHLLQHYSIQKPLKSYHKFSEAKNEDWIITDLENGKNIALISDAGTPAIADPGARLVKRCKELSIEVCPIPGPCAAITALCCSGFNTDRFQFVGFLPKKISELCGVLAEYLEFSGTTIAYESPKRILEVVEVLSQLAPKREIAIARELTKKFEEIVRGSSLDVLNELRDKTILGEIVLLINAKTDTEVEPWDWLPLEKHLHILQETYHLSHQEALKIASAMRGESKRDLYKKLVNQKNEK